MTTSPDPDASLRFPLGDAADRDTGERPVSAPAALFARPPVSGGPSALLSQLLLAVLCGGYAVGSAFGWGSDEIALVMGDFGLSRRGAAPRPSPASSTPAAAADPLPPRLAAVRPLLRHGRAAATQSGGGTRWCCAPPVPSPSLADLFFLCFAPPAIVGLLVLAKRPVTRAGWVCLALDAWLIGGSLLTLSWSLALAQTAQLRRARASRRIALSLAYPLLDIVLVSMVLALHFRRSAANRSAINTAIAALALTVLCDALFTSPLLREHYHSGQLLDAGWFAGSLLLAYAPWVARLGAGRVRADRSSARGARAAGHRAARSQVHWPPSPRISPPLSAPSASSTTCLDGRRVDRVVRPHRLHGGAGARRPPGHHAARQHRPHPGAGAEGEPLPVPGAGLQRRHHDRRADRHAAVRQPGRRRASTDGTPRIWSAPSLPRSSIPKDLGRVVHEVRRFLAASPAGRAHHPHRVPLPIRRRAAGSTSSPPSTGTRAA